MESYLQLRYIFENNPKTLVTKKRYPKGTNAWEVGQLLTTGETYKWYVEGCGKQSAEYVCDSNGNNLDFISNIDDNGFIGTIPLSLAKRCKQVRTIAYF